MKISNDIRIFIVEDDAAQSKILRDKLLEYNSDYVILEFKSGRELLDYFKNGYPKNKSNYLILDYYLQTKDDAETLTGFEVIKAAYEQVPKLKIILFSACAGDEEDNFKKIKEEPNVLEFVKKTTFAYSSIQNIIRFDYAQNTLLKKKQRFQWTLALFLTLLSIAVLHFIYNYFTF